MCGGGGEQQNLNISAPYSNSLPKVGDLVNINSELGSMRYLLHIKYTFFYKIENGSAI